MSLRTCVPGLDVKVVGGPSVLEVVNSSSKHHGQYFQFGEPVLGQVIAQSNHWKVSKARGKKACEHHQSFLS